jgi:hypothetical protein
MIVPHQTPSSGCLRIILEPALSATVVIGETRLAKNRLCGLNRILATNQMLFELICDGISSSIPLPDVDNFTPIF